MTLYKKTALFAWLVLIVLFTPLTIRIYNPKLISPMGLILNSKRYYCIEISESVSLKLSQIH
jgi:hypothetical protein